MAETTWEKVTLPDDPAESQVSSGGRLKFILGGVALLAVVAYLMLSGTLGGARYFVTVDELVDDPSYVGSTIRISGAVLGPSIQYDSANLVLDFTIAHIPQDYDDLAQTLHNAVHDPSSTHLNVHMVNEVKPDLLEHEAQAIITGVLREDGVFYADELLLKCPSRFGEGQPEVASAS